MSSSNFVRLAYKKEASYGVKRDAVKASKVIQDITYTAVKGGETGNSITIQYANTATAGAETVTVTGNVILVGIQSTVSTATQVSAAIGASAAALALISRAITGTAGTAQVTVAATPLLGGLYDWNTARFISEKYSGTPDTTESAQIRTDRMSSGQVVTGLKVDGGHNFELAKELAIEDFMESAMLNAWDTTSITGTFSTALDATAKTATRGGGSFITDGLVAGDFVVFTGFVNTGNNVVVQIMSLTATVLTFAGPTGMVTETHSATYTRCAKLSVGTTTKSLTVEKTFTDLTTKAILYKGVIAGQMELDIAYGALISGSFSTQGNSYGSAAAAADFLSYLEYIDAPATTQSMNGSVDMPFTMTNVSGSFVQDTFCIQSLKVQLNNNLQPQTCIGRTAPEAYSAGTASIKIDLSSYLKDTNWSLLASKLSQAPFALGFLVKNTDGYYGFFFPAIQVSFDDPASGGANQLISMSMTGTAKVGASGESEMSIFKIPG